MWAQLTSIVVSPVVVSPIIVASASPLVVLAASALRRPVPPLGSSVVVAVVAAVTVIAVAFGHEIKVETYVHVTALGRQVQIP